MKIRTFDSYINKALIFLAAFFITFDPALRCDGFIIFLNGPEDGEKIVFNKVDQILQFDQQCLAEDGLQAKDLTIGMPHRWYSVSVKDLASGRMLTAAKSNQWRYILLHGTNAVGAATINDLDLAADGKSLRCSGVFQTCFSKETMVALRKAETLSQVKKAAYEVRFLTSPTLGFATVWLHGKKDDIIIPLPPTFQRYAAYQAYSEKDVLKLLMPEAKRISPEQAAY